MRSGFVILFVLPLCVFAQESSKITSIYTIHAHETEIHFTYHNRNKLHLPDSAKALLLFLKQGQYMSQAVSITSHNGEYNFSFKVPDSVKVMVMGIVDAVIDYSTYNSLVNVRYPVTDNNESKGFIVYSSPGKSRDVDRAARLELLDILQNYAPYYLEVTPPADLLRQYKMLGVLQQRFSKGYFNYLKLIRSSKFADERNAEIQYLMKNVSAMADSERLARCYEAARILGIDTLSKSCRQKITHTYPTGRLARENFINEFSADSSSCQGNVAAMLRCVDAFKQLYGDSSSDAMDIFYTEICTRYAREKEILNLDYFESFITDKRKLASNYNFIAGSFVRKYNPGNEKDIDLAMQLSRKSLAIIDDIIRKDIQNAEAHYLNAIGERYKFLNTYAKVLSNMNNIDSAFLIMEKMYSRKNVLNIDGLAAFLKYAEAVKGKEYVKSVIRNDLLFIKPSAALSSLFLESYARLGFDPNDLVAVQASLSASIRSAYQKEILLRLNGTKLPDATLTHMNGTRLPFNAFKGKLVVIDFWATWCTPCVEKLTAMQQLKKKHEGDTTITFVFVNVWENWTSKQIQSKISKLSSSLDPMQDWFMDYADEIPAKFKLTELPTYLIVDKNQEMIYLGGDFSVIDYLLQQNAR